MKNFRQWAHCIKSASGGKGTTAIMQLNHAGRQSPRFIGGRNPWTSPYAPSANPMTPREGFLSRLVFHLLFQVPRSMIPDDIDLVIAAFARGANVANEAGFDGIQLHASHGCELTPVRSIYFKYLSLG
jgi:2,4-dienoyl-CoA reductase-like NADH-dependent reductase (Old Yellow Enzyme family)